MIRNKKIYFFLIAALWCLPAKADLKKLLEDAENGRQIYALYPQVSKNFASICMDCSLWAKTKSLECKNPAKQQEIENFMRHICWQANLTFWYGEEVAKGIGDIHEGIVIHPNMTPAEELDGCIDQKNNISGRKVGKRVIQGLKGLSFLTYGTVMKFTQSEILRTYSDYCTGQPPVQCPKRLQSLPHKSKSETGSRNH